MKKFIFSSAILMAFSFLVTAQNSIHVSNGKSITVQARGTDSYQLPNEEIEMYFGEEEGIANIYRSENETKVAISVNVKFSGAWVFFSENTFLKDCETGDLYKVRRMERSIARN